MVVDELARLGASTKRKYHRELASTRTCPLTIAHAFDLAGWSAEIREQLAHSSLQAKCWLPTAMQV